MTRTSTIAAASLAISLLYTSIILYYNSASTTSVVDHSSPDLLVGSLKDNGIAIKFSFYSNNETKTDNETIPPFLIISETNAIVVNDPGLFIYPPSGCVIFYFISSEYDANLVSARLARSVRYKNLIYSGDHHLTMKVSKLLN